MYHDHTDGHHHSDGILGPMKFNVTLNYAMCVVELITFFLYGHSIAILGAALENAIHGSVWLLTARLIVMASRPPNSRHTYGMGGYRVVAILTNAIFLLAVGVYLLTDGHNRIFNPTEVVGKAIMLVALADIISNMVQIYRMRHHHVDNTILSGFVHIIMDTFAGLAVVGGGAVIWKFGYYGADGMAAMAIGFISVTWALILIRNMVTPFLLVRVPEPRAPARIDYDTLAEFIGGYSKVIRVHDLHVSSINQYYHTLTCHIVWDLFARHDFDIRIEGLRRALHDKFGIEHTVLQSEFSSCEDYCAVTPEGVPKAI